jgi:GAF domain-containing protein
MQDEAQKQILLYVIRFRETVFVHNIETDERFCNIPRVISVIALPIIRAADLLGVLYLVSQTLFASTRSLS